MSWLQRGTDIDGEAANDNFGSSVSLSSDGSILAVGAFYNDGINGSNSGHVRVYKWNGTIWEQRGTDIDGEAANDLSGYSVSLSSDGNILAVGAFYNNGNGLTDNGHVRVYYWSGSSWLRRGSDIDGEATDDNSGYSVSLSSDGTIVAIGAINNSSTNRGHVRVYKWNGSSWLQRGSDMDGEAANDLSGYSVSLSSDGNILAIGAPGNGSTDSGHVRVYYWSGSSWLRRGSDIDGEAPSDNSGYSVSLSSDGNILAVGAYLNNGINGSDSGHVKVYKWNGTSWAQYGADIDGEASNDNSGYSVSLSSDGSFLAIGATYNNGINGSDSGHVRVFTYGSAPSAPNLNSITSGIQQLSLYFTEPTNIGHTSITKYKYSTNNGTTYKDASGISSPIIITELSNSTSRLVGETTYTIRLRAVNSAGILGSASNSLTGTPIIPASSPPPPPSNLSIVPGDGQVTLNWTTPAENLDGSTVYIKYYKIYDASDALVSTLGPYDASGQSIIPTTTIISGLTNNTVYRYYMKTENNNEQISTASQTVQSIPFSSSNVNEATIQSSVSSLLSTSSDKIADTSSLLNTLSSTDTTMIENVIKASLQSTLNVSNLVDVSSNTIVSNVSQIISNITDNDVKPVVVKKAAAAKIQNKISSVTSSNSVTKMSSIKSSITEMISAINADNTIQSYSSNATKEMAQSIITSELLTVQEAVGSILTTAIENVTLKSNLFESLSELKSNEVISVSGSVLSSIKDSVPSNKKSSSFNDITTLQVVVPNTSSAIDITSVPSGSTVYFPMKPDTNYTVAIAAGSNATVQYNSTSEKIIINSVEYTLDSIVQLGEKSYKIVQIGSFGIEEVTGAGGGSGGGGDGNVPCIVEGQRILTARGYVKVEELCESDYIITSDNRQVAANVYNFTVPCTTYRTAPITIKANAFAPRSPPNDIRLSPLHAIQRSKGIWDIPIKAMKRYENVVQDAPGGSVTYYHIETPNYLKDNLVVEGATVESFGVGYCKKHGLKATDVYKWSSVLQGYTRTNNVITMKK
jgi:hypothetical protein